MTCFHSTYEIIELYRNSTPTKILSVRCEDCDIEFPQIQELLQERAYKNFDYNGGVSPVFIIHPNTIWLEIATRIKSSNPKLLP